MACFPVRSERHLVWLTLRKRRNCFRLYQGRRYAALFIWWQAAGFTVADERSAGPALPAACGV
jgi:hypothetical protein